MKRLGFALCTFFVLLAMPSMFAAKRRGQTTPPVTGQVFVTNHTGKHVVVKWQTSLSRSMKSRLHSQDVGPASRKQHASSGVEWFKDDTENQKNDNIYNIFVQVFSKDEKTLMSEQTFKKTVSRNKLFGKIPKDNLYITVESNYSTQIAIK